MNQFIGVVNGIISGQDLIDLTGMTGNTYHTDDINFLMFSVDGKPLYLAKNAPKKNGISWNLINNAGCVYGKNITIKGQDVKVRLLTGGNGDPSSAPGGEWDNLVNAFIKDVSIFPYNESNICQETIYGIPAHCVYRKNTEYFNFCPKSDGYSYTGWYPVLDGYSPLSVIKNDKTLNISLEDNNDIFNNLNIYVNGTKIYTTTEKNIIYNIVPDYNYSIGDNEIKVEVVYNNGSTIHTILKYENNINLIPPTTTLSEMLEYVKQISNTDKKEYNQLFSILENKNVEVSEEDKMSDLIGKVDLLDALSPPLYLYKDGDECVDITGGFKLDVKNSNASFDKLSDRIKMNASGTNSHIYIATTNKIDITNFSKLYVEADYTTSTKSGFRILLKNSYGYGNEVATLNRTSSFEKTILSLDINTFAGSYFVDVFLGNTLETSATASANIYKIWLEK